jgi:molybdate transport system ATP-binding protein
LTTVVSGTVRRGELLVRPEVEAAAGAVVALLGPNGSGKTTTLRVLAGLLPLESGTVHLGDREVDDGNSVFVPARDRGVGMVFQDHLLFPHLNVLDNVAFGVRRDRPLARAELARWGIESLAGRRTRELSGGQAQRVAVARALAPSPRLLLLDEPFASLDAAGRIEMRAALRHRLAAYDAPVVLATHDPVDAFVLADRFVVMADGAVVQSGAPGEVAQRPRTDFVATFVGLNVLRGQATALDAGCVVAVDGFQVTSAHRAGGEVFAAFSPSAVTLHRARPETSARNVWPLRVAAIEPLGDGVRVRLAGPAALIADVTRSAVSTLDLSVGADVWASVKAMEVEVYPA